MLRQAIILAGGMGSRLGDKTKETPKPMLEVGGKPFLQYLVEHLRSNGFKQILITVGYLSSVVKEYFEEGENFGVDIKYIEEDKPAGTAGALLLGEELLDDEFLVINGDTIFDINYWDLYQTFCEQDADGAIALREVEDVSRYGSVSLDDQCVSSFSEKNSNGSGLISGGVYIFHKKVIKHLTSIPCGIEDEILPRLVKNSRLVGKQYDGFFIDIGIPQTLQAADELVPRWWCKPIAFLDKDGVINKNTGYVANADRHEWVLDAIDGVKLLNNSGYRVVIITNQAGIGRGYYSENEFINYMAWLAESMQMEGGHFDDYQYCPHHPTEARGTYRQQCECRKPAPGMILAALEKYCTDKNECFFIGDSDTDMLAAERVGIRGYLFDETKNLKKFVQGVVLNTLD